MITSGDPRSNATLVEIQGQRDAALERCARLAGDCGALQARVSELEEALAAAAKFQADAQGMSNVTPITGEAA